jgi:hypothetical protein
MQHVGPNGDLKARSPAGESFAQKIGAAVHGQGKLSANLFDRLRSLYFLSAFN